MECGRRRSGWALFPGRRFVAAVPAITSSFARDRLHFAEDLAEATGDAWKRGAGAKTTTLVGRIVALLRAGRARIDRLAAITFTEKAAAELKLRLRESLESAAPEDAEERERLRSAAAGLDGAQVTTIHSFAMGLLKERPFEAGLDPGFQVAADVKGERHFDDVWEEWLDARLSEGDPVFVEALHLGVKLDDLRKAARDVVADRDVLGRRVADVPDADPQPLRALVQQKAAHLRGLKDQCLTEDDGGLAAIELLEAFADRSTRAEGPALRSLFLGYRPTYSRGAQKNWADKDTLKLVKAELKALRGETDAFGSDARARIALALRNRLVDFLEHFQTRQREAALVDFQGLLLEARDVLARNTAVRRYFQNRFDALLVDEFQDTDPLQVEIAFFLSEDPDTGPAETWDAVRLKGGKLFLVGDPRQSIYRFRRADLGIYARARERIQAAGGAVLHLTSSFRSVPSIVEFVNDRFDALFRTDPAHDAEPAALVAEREEVHREGARVLTLPIPAERFPEEGGDRVDVLRPLLANAIAGFVHEITVERPWSVRDGDAVRPARPGDVGLLVRYLTGVEHLEEALRARGVGYRLVGGKAYHQRGEVAALRAALTAIDNAADRFALVQALRSPFFGISDADLARYAAGAGTLNVNAPVPEALAASPVAQALEVLLRLHRRRRVDPPSAVVRGLLERTRALPGFRLSREGAQAVANLWKVVEIAQAYEAAGPATLRAFVRFLTDQARDAREEGDSPVGDEAGQNAEILTVHAAKGLEYPIVVVADILAGSISRDTALLDHASGQGWLKIGGRIEPPGFGERLGIEKQRAAAEERRLLYVALTRAKDHLLVPTPPLERLSKKSNWTTALLADVAPAGEPAWGSVVPARTGRGAPFTCHDTRSFFPPPEAEPGPHPADALEGGEVELRLARQAQEAWETERRRGRQSGRGSDAPQPATVTAAAAGDGEREKERRPSAEEKEAARFGKLVHALLARCALDGADVDDFCRALAPEFEVEEGRAADAAALVRETLAGPLYDRVRTAERVLREAPVALTTGGQRIHGVLNLAFFESGRWTVVEFKTGGAGETQAAEDQVRLYGQALQAATGAPVTAQVVPLELPATGDGGD